MSEPPSFGLLGAGDWAMMPGERAALEGVLSVLKPSLSIEIGTSKGGSLQRISAHSEAVHAFDLTRPAELTSERFPNVTFHTGDSHELLPPTLDGFASAMQNVDFAFVDGDHSAVGARRDVEDLLSSRSVGRSIILVHDTLNDRVRAGLEQIDFLGYEKVRLVDLDFVPGGMILEPGKNELWHGLGLIVTEWEIDDPAPWPQVHPAPDVYAAFASALADRDAARSPDYRQLLALEEALAVQRRVVRLMERSWSWRVTAPLRSLRHFIRQTRRR
jgi:methyltransferase family protein